MFDDSQDLSTPRSVSMYGRHWATVAAYAKDQGYGSVSAALRRIVDEWLELKAVALSREAGFHDLEERFGELLAAATQALEAKEDDGYDARAHLETTVNRVSRDHTRPLLVKQDP